MSDRRNELAVAVMAGKLITDQLKGRAERAELVEILADADVQQAPVRDVDGVDLGKVSLCGGAAKAKVVDEVALLRWVKKNRPDQIREVVEPAYIRALLKEVDAEGVAADEKTGEVIPGMELVQGEPFVKVTPNSVAKDRMGELVRESGLLQLTEARRVVAELPAITFDGLDDDEDSPW